MKNIHKGFQLMTNNEINPDNEIYDFVEEYYKKKEKKLGSNEGGEEYFPLEESHPPHY